MLLFVPVVAPITSLFFSCSHLLFTIMATRESSHKVLLSTFRNWRFDEIGFKKEVVDGTVFVRKVWCNVCRRHSGKIQRDRRIRGAAKKAAQNYIDYMTMLRRNHSEHIT